MNNVNSSIVHGCHSRLAFNATSNPITMRLSILTLLCFATCIGWAQDNADLSNDKCFTYDNAGNRVTTDLCVKSLDQDPPKKDEEELADESQNEDKQLFSSVEWRAYPNPTHGIVNYSLSLETEQRITVSVFDMSGKRLVFERMKSAGKGQLDISHLSPGEYILRISSKGQDHSWSILKQ